MVDSAQQRQLQLDGVEITIGGRQLFHGLNLTIKAGEVLTVMGPSGSGKSSLLAAISGTLPSTFRLKGRILLNGSDITNLPPERRQVGILFQDDLLFPHLSVGGNLAIGLNARVKNRQERRERISVALVDCGLQGFENRDPATLSGGQRARVALMRTLLSGPAALLLDEPFNKLDAQLRSQFRDFVFTHAREARLPTILVTHDPEDGSAAGGATIALTLSPDHYSESSRTEGRATQIPTNVTVVHAPNEWSPT